MARKIGVAPYHKKVIQFNPRVWTFYDFVYPNGTNPVEDWYQALSEDSRIGTRCLTPHLGVSQRMGRSLRVGVSLRAE